MFRVRRALSSGLLTTVSNPRMRPLPAGHRKKKTPCSRMRRIGVSRIVATWILPLLRAPDDGSKLRAAYYHSSPIFSCLRLRNAFIVDVFTDTGRIQKTKRRSIDSVNFEWLHRSAGPGARRRVPVPLDLLHRGACACSASEPCVAYPGRGFCSAVSAPFVITRTVVSPITLPFCVWLPILQ